VSDRVRVASHAGHPATPNEDWAAVTGDLMVVLDGGTARTATGCTHGVAWYTASLGEAILRRAADTSRSLTDALGLAIDDVAAQHGECDLGHPATPSAAVAVVRTSGDSVEYLVLGDVTVVAETPSGLRTIVDRRVDATARAERDEADRHPFGSPEKQAALERMKHAELAARNQPGGFWVAAQNPAVVAEAFTGRWHPVSRLMLLTDGAARLVVMFGVTDWVGLLDLTSSTGPDQVIAELRAIEGSDPNCLRWSRNKRHDDATIVVTARA
jgi:hypothetical protein